MLNEYPIVFLSQGVPLVGRFFRNSAALEVRQPAVIVSGSWLNVKEQMATTYARHLATRGFTTFVFDFTGWGESQGSLRHAEIPTRKVADMAAAADFVGSMSFVEPGGVGYLGVCASAQYALRALASGAAIRSFVSVAGWFHDAASVAPFYGQADGISLRTRRALEAQQRFLATGEIVTVPAYAPNDDRAGMSFEMDYYANRARGAVPAWKNEMAEQSWLYWLTYDGLSSADAVTTPTLLVHSDECALPVNARAVHARLRGKKQLAWLDGTQTDYYDLPPYVEKAGQLAVDWFAQTLPR